MSRLMIGPGALAWTVRVPVAETGAGVCSDCACAEVERVRDTIAAACINLSNIVSSLSIDLASGPETVRFEKLQHRLPHHLVAEATAPEIEGVFGMRHADEPRLYARSPRPVGKGMGSAGGG